VHIETERQILREEQQHWGCDYWDHSKKDLSKRLEEYETADLITVPSNYVKRTFIDRGVSASKLAVIPYGVDLDLFSPEPKIDKVFRIIYAGAISIRKGVVYLLEAICNINMPNVEIVLIGSISKDMESHLRKYRDKVTLVDFMPRAKLRHYFSQGSVLIQPSIMEGLSLVMAQAMACGLPVIATPNTGAEDLFLDNQVGFIVPPRDPQAIREKILYLYENPVVRDEMSTAALKRVQAMGGWDAYGSQIEQVYRALLGQNTPGSSTLKQ
jgi:glycosyltransferase involved in cell wall biosynthesis